MVRYRVKRGVHNDVVSIPVELVPSEQIGGIQRPDVNDPIWKDKERRRKAPADTVSFYPGDVIETDRNLEMFNVHEGGQVLTRFERLDGTEPVPQAPKDDLDGMNVADLRALAEAEEIDLPAKLNKAQMIQAIRGQLNYRQAVGS